MSLIFKALQNFKQPKDKHGQRLEESAPKRNGYSFRRILFSPSVTLCAAAAIFVAGILFVQAQSYFSRKGQFSPPAAEASLPAKPLVKPTEPISAAAAMGDVEPAPLSHPAPDSAQEATYQVHVPERIKQDFTNPLPGQEDQMRYDLARAPGGEDIVPAAQTLVSSPGADADSASPIRDSADNAAVGQLSRPSGSTRETSFGKPAVLSAHVGPDALTPPGSAIPSIGPDGDAENEAGNAPSAIEKPIRSQQRQAERATRHLQVARLVNKIHVAIQTDDVKMTSKLLKKLAQFKGPKHPFVSKLKAYSLIRQDRLEEAKPLLAGVLAQSVDDLEAGLNMSVIEIKTGLYSDARRRLERLQELYPAQDKVSFYLKQLPR